MNTITQPAPRKQTSLRGRSVPLDPRTEAVRGDLADVELADKVFAPHYARAVSHVLTCATTLYEQPDGVVIDDLEAGAHFNVLDISGGWAWGKCPERGLVGYLSAPCVKPA